MPNTIHPSAEVSDDALIGDGTRIWHHSQIRENAVLGGNCNIGKNVYIDFGVKVGSRVKIQNNACLYHGLEVEDDVFIGPGVCFTNDLYPRAALWDESRISRTLVKKGASIGANSTVVCGNTIGSYALVGAGSVVTHDVPDYALVAGNPAKIIGYVCECGMRVDKDRICRECGRRI
jgi:UDP-2-acetamido-3-amino-2,3-dideoxy-glucuronate N-acetyltransferase